MQLLAIDQIQSEAAWLCDGHSFPGLNSTTCVGAMGSPTLVDLFRCRTVGPLFRALRDYMAPMDQSVWLLCGRKSRYVLDLGSGQKRSLGA